MGNAGRRTVGLLLLGAGVVLSSFGGASVAAALEVGQTAPNFTLPSTMGTDLSLSDFKGKTFVFVEFYGADFVPT
jgi:hypothetical protein